MNAIRLLLLAGLTALTGCMTVRSTEGSSVPNVTRNIEHGFFQMGGGIQKFFTGHDTFSSRE